MIMNHQRTAAEVAYHKSANECHPGHAWPSTILRDWVQCCRWLTLAARIMGGSRAPVLPFGGVCQRNRQLNRAVTEKEVGS
jgi:hypothetical protein